MDICADSPGPGAGAAGSTEDVAHRAEVGIATVFRHFPTKAALVETALVRHFDLLSERASALAFPLARLPVAGPGSRWLMVRARTATIDTDGSQLAAEAPIGDDPLSQLAVINMTVVTWRVDRLEPASRRKVNVLVVDEDRDSWGHDVADLEKAPPVPEDGGEKVPATLLA
ncbi:helix-turn-helix domain-containing protein [Pseudofrankia sp. BMG5.37]|uniref:TetR/AcrR family transcriptional regulator n=1 Tax=Pseudofrankia sp. BMG5.37 TaxID=3050035 RepID=UPI002895358F|nr:helix-turn-helix domain-containing protein [Pseudofrankia sp. BMG5.37]MDT3439741.1 helix-turn-helix domain-containing protein [Pseudofrankia sp. BMG5.37]